MTRGENVRRETTAIMKSREVVVADKKKPTLVEHNEHMKITITQATIFKQGGTLRTPKKSDLAYSASTGFWAISAIEVKGPLNVGGAVRRLTPQVPIVKLVFSSPL